MSYVHLNRSFFYIAVAILICTGCTSQIDETIHLCPGRDSADEALSVLRSRSQNIVPFRATGQAFVQYYTEDSKLSKQNFPIKLWLNPPTRIYMQGDVAFDPQGVVIGSNENEFWIAIRIKDVSTYYWGRWKEANYIDELILSPKIMLEALGLAIIDSSEIDNTWSLSNETGIDIVTRHDSQGRVLKRLYIDCCDYNLRKIEYLDSNEQPAIIVELARYKQLTEDFVAPTKIKIVKYTNSHQENSVAINLSNVKAVSFTTEQQKRLFTRPEPKGFNHIYRIIYGDIIEQPQ